MKQQYLGDSKDSFKWDYHDYLTSSLKYRTLNIILMLTPPDNSGHGETHPKLFPARQSVLGFCEGLRKERDFQLLKRLPKETGSSYLVELHKPEDYLTKENRKEYFSKLANGKKQVLFLDPDNGFEPEKSNNEKHILFSDIGAILEQISEEAVISVFQHFRRISFAENFALIRERLPDVPTTAICWDSVMFVAISKSKEIIKKVTSINDSYRLQEYLVKVPLKVLQSVPSIVREKRSA